MLTLMREAGISVETVKEPPTPDGVLDKIATVGRLAGLEQEARALAEEVDKRYRQYLDALNNAGLVAKASVSIKFAMR